MYAAAAAASLNHARDCHYRNKRVFRSLWGLNLRRAGGERFKGSDSTEKEWVN